MVNVRPTSPAVAGDRAFTVAELLVVTAIIGILASLLLPALSAAQRRARSLRCAQNLRQLGLGMRMYADADPAGLLPGPTRSGRPPVGLDPSPSWVHQLRDPLGNVDGIRICPADPYAAGRRADAGSSYVLNEYTSAAPRPLPLPDLPPSAQMVDPDGRPLLPPRHIRRLDALPRPSETMLAFEGSDLGYLLGDERTHPDTWFFGWENVLADIAPERHSGAANYLFADGHVEAIRAARLRARLAAGDHFAIPAR